MLSACFTCDCLQFKKARLDLDQIRRPPSAGEGTARADAERRAYKQVEKAQMMAKRVEQTMAKVNCLALAFSTALAACQLLKLCCMLS